MDRNQVAGVEQGPKAEAGVCTPDAAAAAMATPTEQKASSFLANAHVWLLRGTAKAWKTDAHIRKMPGNHSANALEFGPETLAKYGIARRAAGQRTVPIPSTWRNSQATSTSRWCFGLTVR